MSSSPSGRTDASRGHRSPPPGLGRDLIAFCEVSRTLLWVWDTSKRAFLFVNDLYEELWGRPISELYENPTSWQAGVHEDDRERVMRALEGLADGRYDVEYRVRKPSGEILWVHARAVLFDEGPDRSRRIVGCVQPSGALHGFQAALQAISEALPSRFEDSVQALLRLILEETQAQCAFLGRSRNENDAQVEVIQARDREGPMAPFTYDLPGSPCERVFDRHLCCYPRGVARLFAQDHLLGEMGVEGYLGVPMVDGRGAVIGILVALFDQPIPDADRARALFRVCGERISVALDRQLVQSRLEREVRERTRDLETANRELQTARERYRAFVQGSAVGIWCIELPEPVPFESSLQDQSERILTGGTLVECNDLVAHRLGFKSGSEATGVPLAELGISEFSQALPSLLEAVQGGLNASGIPRDIEFPDGTRRHLRLDLVPIVEEGGLIRLWCMEHDVTEQARHEESLLHDSARLIQLSRINSLGEISAGIAHELNQPLGAIVNYARGSIRRLGAEVDDEVQAALEAIVTQAQRAAASVRRLRELTAAARSPWVPTACSARRIIQDAVPHLAHLRRRTGATLILDFATDTDRVWADPAQVEEVVIQLLRNAYEAIANHEPKKRAVTIRTRRQDERLIVQVCDNGPGLTPHERDHAFDPFFSGRRGGIGLGLTVARRVIEAHGGRLWYSPATPGDAHEGAMFSFSLPLASST